MTLYLCGQGVAPTQDVFQAAIACCSSVGRWRETLNTMENMRISGHDPEVCVDGGSLWATRVGERLSYM